MGMFFCANHAGQQNESLTIFLLEPLPWRASSAGVIDADYRGPVGVILFNWGDQPFEIKVGDRIAQLILEQIVLPDVCQVEDLASTERGANGFGSTGVGSDEESPGGNDAKKQRTVSPTEDPPVKEEAKQDPPTEGEETK